MKQSLNMHRPSSAIAAVLMLASQALTVAASLSLSDTYIFLIRLLGNTLITVMLSVILFRGRKDVVAGVVLLITVIAPVLTVAYHLLSILLTSESILYILLCLLSTLVLAAFRGLSAWECLSQGMVSTGSGRMLLWLLPCLCFCIELGAQIILCLYNGVSTGEAVTSSLVFTIPQWLGPILMGVSLCLPAHNEA